MNADSSSQDPRAQHSARGLQALAWLIAAGILLGCSTIFNTAMIHVVQPQFGPCAEAMDSVRKLRGDAARKEYNDTQDLDTGHQQVEHVWYYTADPAAVVRFSWDRAGYDCAVLEERLNAPAP